MTHEQFDRWQDFALRMARTCYRNARRPNARWIEARVEEFFDAIDKDDIVCIVSWDHSTAYPEGNPCHGRENNLSGCSCNGYRYHHENHPNPQCEECHGTGLHHRLIECGCISDAMSEFLCEYEPRIPQCQACSVERSTYFYAEQADRRVQHWRRFIARNPNENAVATYLRDRAAKEAEVAECRCDELEQMFADQWDEQWGGPVRCCIRAGLDCASAPSAGVVGFNAGDVRRMYPEGVPDWVFPPDERLKFWLSDELDGTFAELSDSAGVVL